MTTLVVLIVAAIALLGVLAIALDRSWPVALIALIALILLGFGLMH